MEFIYYLWNLVLRNYHIQMKQLKFVPTVKIDIETLQLFFLNFAVIFMWTLQTARGYN